MTPPAIGREALETVARALGSHLDSVVFVGGLVIPLLITDAAANVDRPTDDLDVIVETAVTLAPWYEFTSALRDLGFRDDARENAPMCRMLYRSYCVDFMPVEGKLLGLGSRWFRAACEASWLYKLTAELHIRVAAAPQLLATKAEAFLDRGGGDFVASKDIEDFLAVVDGREEFASEFEAAPDDVRDFLRATVSSWLSDRDFLDALLGHLRGDQLRVPILERRLRAIAGSTILDGDPTGME